MKFSYNILQGLIEEQLLDPKALIEQLTMHSFETIIDREFVIDPSVIVVNILKIEPHPNADRLRLATITDGTQEIRVVCGAPNISEGDVVPYSPPGTKVYDEDGKVFELSVAKIRGVESPGMLNSVRELGFSDNHGGIFLLPNQTPIGSQLADHLPSDTVLDIDVLPDRRHDASTHAGIAREIAALMQVATKAPKAISDMQLLYIQAAELQNIGEEEKGGAQRTVLFDPEAPSRIAGIPMHPSNVKMNLERVGFSVVDKKGTWEVGVPSYRPDVLGQHDLVDEVIRLYGFDDIPPSDIVKTLEPIAVSDQVYWLNQIRGVLTELGFTETYSYSFEDERFAKLVNADIHPHVELTNPIAPEMKKLRYSMLPGLISAMVTSRDEMHRNKKGQERALFEIGRVYHVGDGGAVPGIIERPVVSGIAVGDEDTLLRIVDTIRDLFELEAPTVVAAEKPFASVQRLEYAGEFFGMTYVLNQEVLQKMKYRMPVVAFEISFNALLKHAPDVEIPIHSLQDVRESFKAPSQFTELPKFPSVFRDISLLVDSEVGIDALESEINQVGGALVVDVDLFDEYQKEGEAKKSLAFHIEYRSAEKTLNDSEVTEIHKKIEHTLKKQFGAEIR